MRLHELAAMPELKLDPITGEDGFDRPIRWVVTTDLLDPSRYLSGGELVLTGLVWRSSPADSERFVAALTASGVSALAASDGGEVPADLVESCRRHALPLFRVPEEVAFATVTEHVVRRLSTARASDLKAVLDRHRQLVAGVIDGSGLPAVLELLARDLGMRCWVLSPSGRVIAGSHPFPDALAPRGLARCFLTARRLPVFVAEHTVSLFAVDEAATSRVSDWFVVCEGDWREWPAERIALTDELTAIVTLERTRMNDRLSVSGRLSQDLVRMVVAGAATDEILPRMELVGLDTDTRYVAVAAGASGATLRPGELRVLLHEILRDPEPVVGLLEDEAVALLPVAEGADRDITGDVAQSIRDLSPGLAGSELSVGVSGVVEAGELRGAVEEARYARGLAAARTDPACVVGHDELATHMLLLASVPDNVRQTFRLRLLDPLRSYDDVHRADLIRTLETFLRCNGSWTKSAEQMHLHVNSVRYRIQRIEQLTGRDLSRLEDRVDFFLALRLG